MRNRFSALAPVLALALPLTAGAAEGLVTKKSPYPAQATADKLANVITGQGFDLQRIDHSDAAEEHDLELRPTEVFVFGNPEVGTPLMKCAPTLAIDLPLKALVWEDDEGEVRVGYNDPEYLKERHEVEGCDEELEKMSDALDKMLSMTVAKEGTGED
ncbi:MAG: DUF302 domain-containing protein [Marinobacter sp.]